MPMRFRTIVLTAALLGTALLAGCTSAPSSRATHAEAAPAESWDAFLLPTPYATIVVQPYYAAPFEPGPDVMEVLAAAMTQMTPKPVRLAEPIQLHVPRVVGKEWTTEELDAVMRAASPLDFGEYGLSDEAILEVYYLDGFGPGRSVGLEVDGRTFIFGVGIADLPPAARFEKERRTLVHEFGHAIGLVNCGIPMVTAREDVNQPCHSVARYSVMRQATVAFDQDPVEVNALNWQFDEDDIADVRTYQASFA